MKRLMLIVLLAALYLIKLQAPIDVITPENNYRKTVNDVYGNLELYTFLDSLAIPESGNIDHYPIIYKGKKVESPYHIVNGIGAAGRWQMMPCARKDVGYKGTLKEFLSSPDIQRKCIIKFMKKNKKYMDYYIPNYRDYIGKEIITHRKVFTKRIIQGKDTIYKKCIIRADTAVITFSGLIGTMHLTGVGGLKRLLYNKINSTDGNATAMQYMKRFKDFKISNVLNSEDMEKKVLIVYGGMGALGANGLTGCVIPRNKVDWKYAQGEYASVVAPVYIKIKKPTHLTRPIVRTVNKIEYWGLCPGYKLEPVNLYAKVCYWLGVSPFNTKCYHTLFRSDKNKVV